MKEIRKILEMLGYDYELSMIWLISLSFYLVSLVLVLTTSWNDFLFCCIAIVAAMSGTAAFILQREKN